MPPNAADALRWLEYANADIELIRDREPDTALLRGLCCFHYQQAAEKALKAVIVSLEMQPPHVHLIVDLLDMIASTIDVPDSVQQAKRLTPYAVASRYPDEIAEASANDYEVAGEIADVVIVWAESVVKKAP